MKTRAQLADEYARAKDVARKFSNWEELDTFVNKVIEQVVPALKPQTSNQDENKMSVW